MIMFSYVAIMEVNHMWLDKWKPGGIVGSKAWVLYASSFCLCRLRTVPLSTLSLFERMPHI
jgi:hypothetical protein